VSITRSIHASSPREPPSDSGSTMFSRALSVGIRLKAWKMKPTCSRRRRVSAASPRVERSTSPIQTLPDVSESSPARQCMSVDLPEPLGPMMALKRPRSNPTVTPSSARTSPSPLP